MAPVKVVIVGCGRLGSRLAAELDDEGHEVTIIDTNPAAFSRSAARGVFSESFRGSFVIGDGTEDELLRRAGVDEADCFIAVTEGDNRNIMSAQIAQTVFKVPRVVCRIYDPIRDEVYRSLGLHVFCPTTSGATHIRQMLVESQS
jgi:trk system potassium uptake protein TrkA